MRHALVFFLALAACRAHVSGTLRTGRDADRTGRTDSPGRADRSLRAGRRSRPTAPHPGQPSFRLSNRSSYHIAFEVDGQAAHFGRTVEVRDGAENRQASLLEPGGRAWLPLETSGGWDVKVLCYYEHQDGTYRLWGGTLRHRREDGYFTVLGPAGGDCRPIEAARASR